jgi:hypothetical protein
MTTIRNLSVADDPDTWARLGFVVEDGAVRVGSVSFNLTGAQDGGLRGITSWLLGDDESMPASIDGLVTSSISGQPPVSSPPVHPNGIVAIDHLVVSTPNIDRTVSAFEDLDWECRRRREGAAYGQQRMRQAFFWLGDVIVEVVGPETSDPAKAADPASFFGIAFTAADLAATQAFYGELMKPPVEAVQAGRFITTVSSKAGSTLAIAVMSPHVKES